MFRAVLPDRGYAGIHHLRRKLAERNSVEKHLAAPGLVQSADDLGHRGFSAAGGSHKRHGAAAVQPEAQPLDKRLLQSAVPEGNIAQLHPALQLGGILLHGGAAEFRVGAVIIDVLHAADIRADRLDLLHHSHQLVHWLAEGGIQAVERQQHAHGEFTPDNQHRPCQEHPDGGKLRHHPGDYRNYLLEPVEPLFGHGLLGAVAEYPPGVFILRAGGFERAGNAESCADRAGKPAAVLALLHDGFGDTVGAQLGYHQVYCRGSARDERQQRTVHAQQHKEEHRRKDIQRRIRQIPGKEITHADVVVGSARKVADIALIEKSYREPQELRQEFIP